MKTHDILVQRATTRSCERCTLSCLRHSTSPTRVTRRSHSRISRVLHLPVSLEMPICLAGTTIPATQSRERELHSAASRSQIWRLSFALS